MPLKARKNKYVNRKKKISPVTFQIERTHEYVRKKHTFCRALPQNMKKVLLPAKPKRG